MVFPIAGVEDHLLALHGAGKSLRARPMPELKTCWPLLNSIGRRLTVSYRASAFAMHAFAATGENDGSRERSRRPSQGSRHFDDSLMIVPLYFCLLLSCCGYGWERRKNRWWSAEVKLLVYSNTPY